MQQRETHIELAANVVGIVAAAAGTTLGTVAAVVSNNNKVKGQFVSILILHYVEVISIYEDIFKCCRSNYIKKCNILIILKS